MSSRRPNDDLGTQSHLEAVLAAGFDSLDLGKSTGVPADFKKWKKRSSDLARKNMTKQTPVPASSNGKGVQREDNKPKKSLREKQREFYASMKRMEDIISGMNGDEPSIQEARVFLEESRQFLRDFMDQTKGALPKAKASLS